jgi:hypothetical protein
VVESNGRCLVPPKKKAAKKKMGGRPTKLTPAVKNKIVEAVKRGTPLTAAAAAAGISNSAVTQWMKWGREGKAGGFKAFAADVLRAREAAIDVYVRRVCEASDNDHRAAAWMLARLDPANFGDPGKRQDRDREGRIYEAQVKKLEAEARLASAKAVAAEQLAKRLETGDEALENVVALMDDDDARDVIMAAMRAVDRTDPAASEK